MVERAASFTKGQETEEAWKAALDAKTIYEAINRISVAYVPKPAVDEQGPVIAGGAQAAKAAQSYMARQVAAHVVQRGWRGISPSIDRLVDHWEIAIAHSAPRHVTQELQDRIENEIKKHRYLHTQPPSIGAVRRPCADKGSKKEEVTCAGML